MSGFHEHASADDPPALFHFDEFYLPPLHSLFPPEVVSTGTSPSLQPLAMEFESSSTQTQTQQIHPLLVLKMLNAEDQRAFDNIVQTQTFFHISNMLSVSMQLEC
jgi:hypothetical protein